mmetsp:Transcript_35878/g.86350  ORF Transcript_35878/g.86350 Transcript_35878/m.86350 type:complete len:228 (+) Transcript_35878:725-1408(+)
MAESLRMCAAFVPPKVISECFTMWSGLMYTENTALRSPTLSRSASCKLKWLVAARPANPSPKTPSKLAVANGRSVMSTAEIKFICTHGPRESSASSSSASVSPMSTCSCRRGDPKHTQSRTKMPDTSPVPNAMFIKSRSAPSLTTSLFWLISRADRELFLRYLLCVWHDFDLQVHAGTIRWADPVSKTTRNVCFPTGLPTDTFPKYAVLNCFPLLPMGTRSLYKGIL